MSLIQEFLIKNNLGKFKITGEEYEFRCPFSECASKEKPTFYINRTSEVWICHRCSKSGKNLKTLAYQLGFVELKEPTKAPHIFIPIIQIEIYQKSLQENKEASTYLINKRGLKQSTIIQFKLGYKLVDNQPAIVIPYFDKTKSCVGMKYDFFLRPAGVEKYRKERGTKTEPLNSDKLNLEQPVIITEGEYDAISLWQYGYTNVISMPNGANGISGWVEEIESAKEFYLSFDNDEVGFEAAQKLADILGRSKCKQVFPRLKDINEYLQHGLDKSHVDLIFKQAQPMFNAPVTNIGKYIDDAKDWIENPNKAKGFSTGWKSIDYYLGGIRLGEVTVMSGITSHGKSTFGLALINNLIQQDVNCLVISPEMKEQALLLDLANGYFRKKVKDIKDVEEFVNLYNDKIYIANVFDKWTIKKKDSLMQRVFDIIEYSVRNNNVRFVLLDHMRLFLSPKEQDGERFEIDKFMEKCVHTAIKNNIHIWLIVQPKNLPAAQKKVTLHDLKGSSNISQDTNNVVLIHRNTDSKKQESLVEIDIVKNRELGLCGTAVLDFNLASSNNYDEVKR